MLNSLSTRLAAVAVLSLPAVAFAQMATRPTIGVSGGLAVPTGDFGDNFKSGYNVSGNVGFKPSALPVGLRIEGMYNRFDAKGASNGVDGHFGILAGTGNIVLTGGSGSTSTVRPYVIAGAGVYNLKSTLELGSTSESISDTKFGINGGAGIDLPLSGIAAFIEARYHYVFTKQNGQGSNLGFVPVTVGVRF